MEEAEIPRMMQNKENIRVRAQEAAQPEPLKPKAWSPSSGSLQRLSSLPPLVLITYLALGLDTGLCRFLLGSDIVPRSQTELLSALLLERIFGSFSVSAILCSLLQMQSLRRRPQCRHGSGCLPCKGARKTGS